MYRISKIEYPSRQIFIYIYIYIYKYIPSKTHSQKKLNPQSSGPEAKLSDDDTKKKHLFNSPDNIGHSTPEGYTPTIALFIALFAALEILCAVSV